MWTLVFAVALFPLKMAPGGRCLVDAAGNPFLIHGDTPWSLTQSVQFVAFKRRPGLVH